MLDILAMDLDQRERVRDFAVDLGVHGFDERALTHSARAPKQRVVGRQPLGEAAGIVEQDRGDAVDAAEEREVDVRHFATARSRLGGSKTKASAAVRSFAGAGKGARRSRALAIRSRTRKSSLSLIEARMGWLLGPALLANRWSADKPAARLRCRLCPL